MIRKNKFIFVGIVAVIILVLGLSISKAISSLTKPRIVLNKLTDERELDQNEVDQYKVETPPIGLQNLSNTCYMSAVLQVLFKIIPDTMRKIEGNLIKSFFKLKDSKDAQTYRMFKIQLQKYIDIVNGWSQQDAHQFLIKFLDALNGQNIESQKISSNIFRGMFLHEFVCPQGHKKFNYEEFNYISLSFPPQQRRQKPITINQLIEFNLQPEIISDLFCIQCNKNAEFIKFNVIQKLPKYLILHLSRFRQNFNEIEKISRGIDYDQKLKFSSQRLQKGVKNIQYQLIGIINHLGGIDSGHYIAEIKTLTNSWYELNDDKVTQISKKQENNISQYVYIMFYQLIQ